MGLHKVIYVTWGLCKLFYLFYQITNCKILTNHIAKLQEIADTLKHIKRTYGLYFAWTFVKKKVMFDVGAESKLFLPKRLKSLYDASFIRGNFEETTHIQRKKVIHQDNAMYHKSLTQLLLPVRRPKKNIYTSNCAIWHIYLLHQWDSKRKQSL